MISCVRSRRCSPLLTLSRWVGAEQVQRRPEGLESSAVGDEVVRSVVVGISDIRTAGIRVLDPEQVVDSRGEIVDLDTVVGCVDP